MIQDKKTLLKTITTTLGNLLPSNTVDTVKPVSTVSKVATKRIVNHDGTIAESLQSYQEFRQDLGNRNYGW